MRPTLSALVSVLLLIACDEKKPPPPPAPAPAPAPAASSSAAVTSTAGGVAPVVGLPKFDPEKTMLFAPIPEGVEKPVIDDATRLGMALFHDVKLSGSGKVACASCHDPAKVGQDGLAAPAIAGAEGGSGARNTPTLWNAGGAFAQGWDARWSTMEELVVPHASEMMGTDGKKLVAAVAARAGEFAKAFPDEKPATSEETIGRALGGYAKKLFARSRWDKYLAGDKSVVTDAELVGFAMFVEAGCTSCHQGKYIGATQTQKLGMAKPWPPPLGAEPGRYAVTKQEGDRGMFKVPSLRNVTRTGPYLHDGSVASLEEVTKLMARHQVGRELTAEQAKAIVTFFGTLEGDPPKELLPKMAGAKP